MEESTEETQAASAEDAEHSGRRPSLAERLMNPPANSKVGQSRTAVRAEAPDRMVAAQPVSEPSRERSTRSTGAFGSALAYANPQENLTFNDALREARRYVRVRYYSFLASMTILFAALAIASGVLVVSLLTDAGWEQQAASGAIAGGALLFLLLMQYRPAGSFLSAAAEIAQLEALRTHLEKSYKLWDDFLEGREVNHEVAANDIALAVSSMTAATREMVAVQAAFAEPRSRSFGAIQDTARRTPTPTVPDPRRY